MKAKPKIIDRDIPATNEIKMYLHCSQCLESIPDGESPRSWAQLEIGMTPLGFQVWCKRHECNVFHMDLQGNKFPANCGRKLDS